MKIAVLAEQNINLIDGSTIWLLNTCRLLTACQGFEVFLLSPHTLIDRTLVDELPKEVTLCHPCDLGAQSVSVSELTSALEAWEQRLGTFDRIYVRGQRFLANLLGKARFWDRVVAYVPGILPRLGTDWPDWINQAKSHRTCLVVQSETAKRVLESLLDYPASCIHVVPPVVFPQADVGRNAPKQTDLVYAGKIDKEYGLEWFQALVREMGDDPDLRAVLIAGKDTGRSRHPAFFRAFDTLRDDLRKDLVPGVAVFEGLGHAAAQAQMARARFGFCLRDSRYDDVFEISTKIIEFCAMGVPPILNDTALNRDLLGTEYPYFVDVKSESVEHRVLEILRETNETRYRKTQERLRVLSRQFFPDALSSKLARAFLNKRAMFHTASTPRHFLFSTHDDKFLNLLTDRLSRAPKIALSWDHWRSTEERGKPFSVSDSVDTIFCEWCCANAVWHSRNKKPGTKLIVRLHRFEAFRDFPSRVNWHNVDAVIVVSEWFKSQLTDRFDVPPEKVHVIPQFVDFDELQRPKLPEARYTLGLVGINPFEHKRFDRALDFLLAARRLEPRFKMAIRSAMPWDIPWVWSREDGNRERFKSQFERIYSDRELSEHIRFDLPGNDMEEWYRGVGTILSCSDTEGCHTAVIEGMASGCFPIVKDWPGARSLFHRHVHENIEAALPELLSLLRAGELNSVRAEISRSVKKWDVGKFEETLLWL